MTENRSSHTENVHHSERLLIIGASARAAAESAGRGGFECMAIDLFRDLDLERACKVSLQVQSLEQIPQVARGLGAESFMYTGCIENRPKIIEEIAQTARLAGCGASSLARVRDPFWLAALAEKQGFRFAECRRAPPEFQELTGAWLRKPFHSGGGRQIDFFDPGNLHACGESWKGGPAKRESVDYDEFYFQKHVAGISISAAFVAEATQTSILGVSRQLVGKSYLGARPFSYCGSLGPCSGQVDLENQLTCLGQAVAKAAGLIGLFGIDAILAADGVTLIEVNPRYTASMEIIDYARGISCVEHHIQACLGNPLPLEGNAVKQIAWHPLPLGEGWGEGNAEEIDRPASITLRPKPLTLTRSQREREQEYGESLVVNASRRCLEERSQRFACKLIQFSQEISPLNVSEEFTAWALSTNRPAFISRVADIPPPGSEIGCGAPIFSVIGVGASEKLAFRRAKRLCEVGYNMVRKTVKSPAK